MLRRMLVLALATAAAAPAIGQSSAQAGSPAAATPALATTPTAPAATPPAPAVVVIPPDLQALEQKALALRLNSERFSASVSVAAPPVVKGPVGGFKHIFGHASSRASALLTTALLTATGEASFVPQEANIQVSFLGLKINARLIGTTLFIEEPFIARQDGGRPWVEEKDQDLERAIGVEPSTLGGGADSGATRAFGGMIEILNKARSIQEVGPATINGQPTTAFKASVLLAELGTRAEAHKRALRKSIKPLAGLEVFFAEDGLPVRTLLKLGLRGRQGEIITQSDILAVNVPVDVQAPPADKTISQARLNELLKRQAEKWRRRLMSQRRRANRSHAPSESTAKSK